MKLNQFAFSLFFLTSTLYPLLGYGESYDNNIIKEDNRLEDAYVASIKILHENFQKCVNDNKANRKKRTDSVKLEDYTSEKQSPKNIDCTELFDLELVRIRRTHKDAIELLHRANYYKRHDVMEREEKEKNNEENEEENNS